MPSSSPVIVFDHPHKQFLPGEQITGRVLIEDFKLRNARSVSIVWKGITRTDGCHRDEDGNTSWQSFERNLFRREQLLLTAKDWMNEIPTGIHKLPFSYTLPKDCPPTLHTSKAINEYTLKVVIDRPWRFIKKVEKEFLVTNKLSEDVSVGAWNSSWIFKSGLFFNQGPIEVKLSMPTKVFQPGQTALFNFTLTNHSTSNLRQIDLLLFKKLHTHARPSQTPCNGKDCPLDSNNYRTSHCQIGEKVPLKLSLAPNTTECHDVTFKIPKKSMTPSFSTGLMSVGYYFQLRVKHCWATSSSSTIKVYIGEKEEEEAVAQPVTLKEQEAMKNVPPPAYTP